MASKRQRSDIAQSSQQFDRTKFVSAETALRYHKVANKSLVPERGLRPDLRQDGEMAAMIIERKWIHFTRQPEHAVISLVREFYVNAVNTDEFVVQVRGRSVAYDRKAINACFQLPNYMHGDYLENGYGCYDLDDVITRLCKPGTTWKLRDITNEKISFSHTELSRYGKAWYSFICANLMPTRHISDVTKERAVLLFAIVTGLKIDFGLVIQESISRALKGSTSGGLPHPSIITGLCQIANVQWGADEILQPPMALIDHATIARYKVWEGAVSHPRGEGYLVMPPPASSSQVGPSSEQQGMDSSSAGLMADLLASLSDLHRKVDKQTRRVDAVAQRQDIMMQYHTEFATTMTQIYSTGGAASGSEPYQFPASPVFPAYPPPSPNKDEGHNGDDNDME